jgi:hypothetical protein
VKDVAGAVGVDDLARRHVERGQGLRLAALVVPEHAALAERHAADAAAARSQVIEHSGRREVHLLAQPFRDDGDIDESEEVMRVGAKPAAVERGQDAFFAAGLGVVDRRVGLVAVEVERPALAEIQGRKGMEVGVVAAAHDGALAAMRHDEGER